MRVAITAKMAIDITKGCFQSGDCRAGMGAQAGGLLLVRVNLIITIPKTMVKDIPGIKLRSKQVGCTEKNPIIAATTSILRLKSRANKLQA